MFANDRIAPEPHPPAVPLSAILWISFAVFIGVGLGATLFGNRAQQTEVKQQPQSRRTDPDPHPPATQPHVIVESQILLKSSAALRAGGSHRVAVANTG